MKNKFKRFIYIADHYREVLDFHEIVSKRWVIHVNIKRDGMECDISTWKMKGVDDEFFKAIYDMSFKMIKECEEELKEFVEKIDSDIR